jgi:hypothetical protein
MKEGEQVGRTIILYVTIILVLYSCAITKINSVTDPEFKNTHYSKLLIISTFTNLLYQQEIEKQFKQYCKYKDIDLVTGSELIPTTREYSESEISKILKQNNIEGILIIAMEDYWESDNYVPQSSYTYGSAYVVGNSISYSQRRQNYGGYTYSKPRTVFDNRLFDAESGKIVWKSSSITRGNAFANFSTLADSLAKATIDKLLVDRILIYKRYSEASPDTVVSLNQISEAEATEELENAKALYLQKNYNESVAKISTLKRQLDTSTGIEKKNKLLAQIHFLWGAYFIDARKEANIAKVHFKKVIEYDPDFKFDNNNYTNDVEQIFAEHLREEISGIAKKSEHVEQKTESQTQELSSHYHPNYEKGSYIRIIKNNAVLRLEPDDKSTVIKELPLGAQLAVEDTYKDWVRIKLPPNKDGIVIDGYVHVSFVNK